MTPTTFYRRRAGFTLIELLTVMFIIAVLAAITVAIARSNIADSYTTVGAGDRLSGWLLIAKNRTLRDRTPVGIRLIRDPNNPNVAREAQYIEMPVLWAPNQVPDGAWLVNPNIYDPLPSPYQKPTPGTQPPPFVVVKYDQGRGGLRQEDAQTAAASAYGVFVFGLNLPAFDIGIGDLLRLGELGTLHRVERIEAGAPQWYQVLNSANPTLYPAIGTNYPCYKITLAQSVIPLRQNEQYPPSPPNPPMLLPRGTGPAPRPNSNLAATSVYPAAYPAIGAANFYRSFFFGFYRAARPILGEPTVTLPGGMVVDMTPDRLEGAGSYPVFRNPSFGLAGINPVGAPLASNAVVPALPDVDILFAPSGQVMFTDSGLVCFWLRNETKPPPNTTFGGTPLRETAAPDATATYSFRYFDRARMTVGGESLLVAVYTKSGAIGTYLAYTPNPRNGALPAKASTNDYYDQMLREDMYKFVRDAFNRGL